MAKLEVVNDTFSLSCFSIQSDELSVAAAKAQTHGWHLKPGQEARPSGTFSGVLLGLVMP